MAELKTFTKEQNQFFCQRAEAVQLTVYCNCNNNYDVFRKHKKHRFAFFNFSKYDYACEKCKLFPWFIIPNQEPGNETNALRDMNT